MAGDGGGVVTNERTGQSYDTITKAVEEAEDDDVIIVGAGHLRGIRGHRQGSHDQGRARRGG